MAKAEKAKLFRVPDPYPLTLAGLLAALGPQAINFGISVGGGETMLIPNLASLGAINLFWIMTISTVLETAVVYECVKYSIVTGRSFFTMTRDIPPRGLFWPWFWAIAAIITFAWPSWLGGAASAMFKLSNVGSYYFWCALALTTVLVVFLFSNIIYRSISRIFIVVMWVNIVVVMIIVAIAASWDDYKAILWGYFNFGFAGFTKPDGEPLSLSWRLLAALYNQPGGSLMWVTLWALEAGWGMGRYTGRVTGVLRPPEEINTEVLPWDTNDPEEVKKMKGWIAVNKWSLIIWWSIIGAMFMTFLYGTAGYAYLYKKGIVAEGLDVPLQMATIAHGVLGPLAGVLFLIFIVVTLYDAEFALYDTFIGRTVSDAISVTPGLKGKRPYRFYYFVVVIAAIGLGFYLVTVALPYALWLFTATAAVLMRGLAAIQILYANSKYLPEPFRPAWYTKILLWITFVTGVIAFALGMWATATGN